MECLPALASLPGLHPLGRHILGTLQIAEHLLLNPEVLQAIALQKNLFELEELGAVAAGHYDVLEFYVCEAVDAFERAVVRLAVFGFGHLRVLQ
jgi:hypothetical protein